MIDLAEYMRKKGMKALHRALYSKYTQGKWQSNKKRRSNKGVYKKFSNIFWQSTDEEFFSQVETLRDRLLDGESFDETKKEWFTYLKGATIELYQKISSQESDRFSRSRMMAYRFLRYELSHEAKGINNRYTTEAGNSISTLWKNEEEGKTSEPTS